MTEGHIKGALLEYIIRQLLRSCGFTNVKSDGLYSFERSGLFFINGKGAAHDADVIMNPPFQVPFGYPTQLLFECKGYTMTKVGLPIIRNALGLRNDINDFEIVTLDFIKARKNNRRSAHAIQLRNRYVYQVGVASINDFSQPAIEFATNNKIPLISLSWFLNVSTIRKINSINNALITSLNADDVQNIYDFLKDREGDLYNSKYRRPEVFLRGHNIIGEIVAESDEIIRKAYVGLLETGDMVFLFSRSNVDAFSRNTQTQYETQIHWFRNRPNIWKLTIGVNGSYALYEFYLPQNILKHWKQFGMTENMALNLKEDCFSKMFVFNKNTQGQVPITIVNIDKRSLAEARESLND